MARGEMMRALRRALESALHASDEGEAVEVALDRRGFLKASGMAALGAPLLLSSACSSTKPDPVPTEQPGGKRVAIVGGGMAGVHCAYRLGLGGVRATLFEGGKRLGGRMFSLREGLPDGMVAELGGELIDTDHVTMQALAKELGIQLDDLFADEPPGFARDTFDFGGVKLTEAQILAEFKPVAAKMAEAATQIEQSDDAFTTLDNTSILSWLDQVGASPLLKRIIDVSYTGEYGLPASEQSVLNLIYLIDYKSTDEFHIYGASDERYHTHLGNDTFVTKLAERLEPGQVMLEHKLVEVSELEDGMLWLGFESGGQRVEHVFDQVVFALPFTTLREVKLDGAKLPPEKMKVIRELGYGTNAKLMMSFTDKVWRTKHNASGSTLTDRGPQTLWDTARGQDSAAGIVTNFVGGQRGVEIGQGSAEEQALKVLPHLDAIYPGAASAYIAGSAVRMHWPTAPLNKGSYGCYKVGQWAMNGEEGKRVRAMHFCGEHCSEDFQGFMEGAAETGAKVAAAVLKELGMEPRVGMLRVTDTSLRALPSACFHGDDAPRMGVLRRRQLRRAAFA
jgi:monoamine oxidase